ncbi:MAG: hypothetical protein EZS28_007498 [Streblomastix strix]|uniref:Transmembrane protein n=1 Tax=Streblomastix strix TaxID=222440 RepID=A0A5J4WPP4_9EUKA|nr:MAG: hypothetical protein EZS28_007498 [Streblomastix strix]
MILILLLAVAIVVTQTLQSFYHDDTLNSKELLESDTASVVCKFDIKQKSSGKYPTVDSALQQPCINKGDYEITLIDSEHHEHLELKNSQTILIKTIINNCLFSNISVLSDQEPVQISTDVDNAYILIRDCQFSNFYSENDDCMAVLQLSSGVQHKVEVVQNSFINCKTNSSLSGAIRIYDFVLDQDNPSQYIIINNTFFNNTGKYSGQDAYLVFVQPPTNWTSETINSIITAMFNGSKSDGRNGSVYYEIYFDTIMDLYGNITLPLLVIEPQKRKTSVLLVFCIIIGVIIGITALAGAIILAILFYQKRQSLFDPSGQMSQSLLTHNGIINESSNH